MSDFEPIDPNEPATIQNLVMAVMQLRDQDEATLGELISKGDLHKVFPFQPGAAVLPPDSLDETEVEEASPRPLTGSKYVELVKASMYSREATSREVPQRGGMKIRPLHDRIVVKRLEEQRQNATGIVIPDTAAEKPDQGEVKAIGKGKVLEDGKIRALDLKVGDRVLFGKYSGQTVKVEGEELLVMREEDIMGVISGK